MQKRSVTIGSMVAILSLFCCCPVSPSLAATSSGSLSQDETWSGLIEISGNVAVPFGYVLKLEPGTVLRFSNNAGLHIYGRFEANGTADSPITFTASSASPSRGIWSGIYFYDSSLDLSFIDHAVIEYASRGVWCGSAHPGIRNTVLSNNVIGIYLSTSFSSITGCTIKDSSDHGIYTEGNCSPYIANNHIVRCSNGIWLNGPIGGPTIRNNIIKVNVNGIHIGYCAAPTILFNTLHNNVTGINLHASYGTTTISSNIITSSNCGITRRSGNFNLSYNDLWDNGASYCELGAGVTDLSVDPGYEDALAEDLRLQEGSSLRDAGQDGGEIGAYGAGGCPALLPSTYSTVPTTSGSLTQSEIWSGLIEISGNVTVPFGYVLKLEPGTVLRFSNNAGLHIYGRFEANGTADSPITFTASSASPSRGIWSGIYFYDSSLDLSFIDHAVIEYASRGVWCGSAHPGIRNTVLSNNVIGIYLSTSFSSITGCTIKDSSDHGIYTEGNCSPYIANNHIVRCSNGIWLNGPIGGPTIRNNIIKVNVNGIHIGYCAAPTILFNTLHNNVTGINLHASYGTTTISSNIITSSNCGITRRSGNFNLSYNDLWNNQTNYSGLSAGGGDISADPLFAAAEDFHLQPGSPCIDAGDPFILDEDDTRADIGAYGGRGGATPSPGDTPPNQPSNALPMDWAAGVSPSVTLTVGAFSDPDPGDFHIASRWQIRMVSGSYTAPIFDSGETATCLTNILIPWGTLQPGTTYLWHVRHKDNKNGWSDYSVETSFTTFKDSVPPDTAITSGPVEGGIAGANVTFTWLGNDAAGEPLTFSYAMDLSGWSSLSSFSRQSFNGLGEGPHCFYVRAKDYSGNIDPTPAVRNFTVDLTSPAIMNVTTPRVTHKLAVVSWETNEPATSQAQYGVTTGYGWGTAQDKSLVTVHIVTLTDLKPDTLYHFSVRSQDQVGNQAVSQDFTFRTLPPVDETPPQTVITQGPQEGALLNTPHVTLSWTGSDDMTETLNLTFAVRLDSESWSAFDAVVSRSFANLADGVHTFEVKAKDEAGLEDPTPVARNFTLDTTPPAPAASLVAETTLQGANFQWTHSPSPDVQFYRIYSDSGLGTIDYSTPYAVIAYPGNATGVTLLRKGLYRFGLRTMDRAGNEEKNTHLIVAVNLSRPDAPTVQPVISPTDASAQILTGGKDAETSLWLNGKEVVTLNTSTTWLHEVTLTEGENRFELFCKNAAGEQSPSVVATIDHESPPAPVSTLSVSGSGPGTSVSLSWAGYDERRQGDVAAYRVYAADHSFSHVGGMSPTATLPAGVFTHTATNLVKGIAYYFAVVAVDARGNAANTVTPVSAVPADTVPPENVTSLRVQCFSDRLLFTWNPSANSANDLAGYKVYFSQSTQGVTLDASQTSFEPSGLNRATSYPFNVVAVDTTGNESSGVSMKAITLLENPANVTVQPYNGRISLSWMDSQPREYVAQYGIYLSESNFTSVAGMTPRIKVTGTTTSIAGLVNDKTYYCAVTAVNLSGGEKKEVEAQSVTPQGDKEGPTISDVRFENAPVFNGMVLHRAGTFTLSARDSSGISRVEFRFDGSLYRTATSGVPYYSCTWSVTGVQDGEHALSITAYDTLGNAAGENFSLVLALDPPQVPTIIYPSGGQLVNTPGITVSGRADTNTEVLLFDNDLQSAAAVAVDTTGNFSIPLVLVEGENHVRAAARNRAGMSPRSAEVVVTLDSTIPQSPTNVSAQSKPGGMIALNWRAPAEGSIRGYNLYRASSPFLVFSQAVKVNGAPLTLTALDDLPATDGTYYYRVSTVDRAGNESELSEMFTGTSDRTLPRALSIDYVPSGRFDHVSGRMGPGAVTVRLTLSEAAQTTPFLSLTPRGGVPIAIELTKSWDTQYSGLFTLTDLTPSGTAHAVFSARDVVGNRGTEVESGAVIEIDAVGPSLTLLSIQPQTPIRNDPSNPVPVVVTIGLNEAAKPGTLPQLSYLLSRAGRTPIGIMDLTLISTRPGQAHSFQGTFMLPPDAGLTEVEILKFLFRCADDLDNVGTRILADNGFQVYQGDLPPLDAPEGLRAESLPGGQVKLSWTLREGADAYQIYRKAPGEDTLSAHLRTGKIAELIESPSLDGRYVYAIASVRHENEQEAVSAMSAPVEAESDALPPNPPRNLSLELLSQGVNAVWQEPLDTSEPVSYSLYRANLAEITSVEGLTAVIKGIKETTVLDSHPSATDHCYVVTAVDRAGNESGPSNSFYLNCKLLPVSSLHVVQNGDLPPLLSWTHPVGLAGGIAGFNLLLRSGGESVRLNQAPIAAISYTDAGYAGDERVYAVTAVDSNGIESLGRSITLPVMKATLKEGESLKRGVMNRLDYTVENLSAAAVERVRLRAKAGSRVHTSEEFRLEAGEIRTIPVSVGGYADLPAASSLVSTISITPYESEGVEISRSGEIAVSDGMLILQILNEELTRGLSGKVQFTMENTGEEEIEIVTAQGAGSSGSNEISFQLTDADGNTLSTVPFRQNLGLGIVTLANGNTVARIPAGSIFTSVPVDLPVPLTAPEQAVIKLSIAKIYYHQGKPEQVTMEGLSARHAVSFIDTAYYGEVSKVDPELSYGDRDILITGEAIERRTLLPMAGVPLNLVITLNGFERSQKVLTDANGAFAYTFRPLPSECGVYRVRAVHPDVLDRSVHAQFTINRVSVVPQTINLNIPKNYEQSVSIQVSTSEGTQIHDLRLVYEADDQPEGMLPEGVHVSLGAPVPMLVSGQRAQLGFKVWADNTAAETPKLVFKVTSDEKGEGSWASVSVNISLSEAKPTLHFFPDHVETGTSFDKTVAETITLGNKGLADLNDVSLCLISKDGTPVPGWVHLNSDAAQGTIRVGEQRPVSFSFSPTETMAEEGDYMFLLRVTSANHRTVDIGIYVAVTQSGTGQVIFKVSDIYTGTVDAGGRIVQGLKGAAITIQNEAVTTIQKSATTDDLGEVYLTELPSGRYTYRVAAANHQERTGRIWVKTGVAASEPVFLDYNLVTVEWEVKETTIEDKYEIVLKVTHETDVPAAVLVAEPSSVYLPQMKQGTVYQGEFTLTNFGLIRADNVRFALPESDPNFRYELLSGLPDSVGARARMTIPYRVTSLTSMGGDGGEDCLRTLQSAAVSYDYGCAAGARTAASAPFAFLHDNGRCSGQPATPPGGSSSGGSGGGTWIIVVPPGGGGGGGLAPKPPPAPIQGAKCLPAPDREESMTGSRPTCPLDTQKDVFQEVGSAVNCALREYTDSAEDLHVKVPGGKIAVPRFFYGNEWRWEDLRNNLVFVMDSLGQYVKTIDKGGVLYELSAAQSANPVFVHDTYTITRLETGYLWRDKHGEWKAFNLSGKMTAYGTPRGVLGKLLYEPEENGRLLGIADRNDRRVIWFDLDGKGRIAAVRDLEGRRVEYGYTEGRMTSVKDVLGNTSTFEYDAKGRMVKKTDAASHSTTISYDSYGNVSKVVDEQGHGHAFLFDYDSGRKEYYARISQSSGMVKEVWYDREGETRQVDINGRTVRKIVKDGRNLLITDERANITRKEFDEWGNLSRVVYPDGSTVSYEYEHKFNQRVSSTAERGTRTEYSYDNSGNLVSKIEAKGSSAQRETRFTHDSEGNVVSAKRVADAMTAEALTVMEYDALGNVSAITDPEGNIMRFTHDAVGNVLTKTDANGKVWAYAYDNAGRLVTATDPLAHTTSFAYDAIGNKVREVDAEGRQKFFVYDEHNRLISSTDTAGNVTRFEYNVDGKLTRRIDPEGKSVHFDYDSEGHLIKAIDGNGNQTQLEYGGGSSGCSSCPAPLDQPAKIVYPTFAKEFNYDSRGRKIEERDILSDTESYSTTLRYDPAGNLTSTTDKESKTTAYAYDELNRLIKMTDATGHDTLYAYDSQDNLLLLTDANGNMTRFAYDRANRQTKEIRPLGQTTTYQHDGVGRLIRKVDAKSQWSEYGYDDSGRLTQTRYYSATDHSSAVKTVAFSYDHLGHLLSYDDGHTSARYEYDDAYRKILETVDYGPFQLSSTTAWYRNGSRKSFTGPDGITYSYEYDANNQFLSVQIPEKGFITYNAYTWNRPSSVTYPGGTAREITYDPLMRINSILVKDPAQNILMNYGYTYDRMDNIIRKTTEDGGHGYAYDDLYRLTHADNPVLQNESYTYDPAGNRLTAAEVDGNWTYNANNELQSYDAVSYTYDKNGNTVQKISGGETVNYAYDVQDRLVRVENGSESIIAQYYYDPFSRRLWKDVSGIRTYFNYADEGLVGECDANGQQQKAYGYRPGSTWTTDPFFMKDGQEYYFYHNDHLGTPMQLTGINGAVVWSARYSSFGGAAVEPSSTIINNLRFPGQYYDETGQHYNWHRYYSPIVARYDQPDIIAMYDNELSIYSYVSNNPTNYMDNVGLFNRPGHELITEQAAIKYGGSLDVIAIINDGNMYVDRPSNFMNNNEHGMRNLFQSRDDAIMQSYKFQKRQLRLAIKAAIQCDFSRSFYELGKGLHSVQDVIAHDYATLIDHIWVSYIYVDRYIGNEHLKNNAIDRSIEYIHRFINALGYNPFVDARRYGLCGCN